MDRGLVRDQKEGGVGEPLPEERQKPDGERVVEPRGRLVHEDGGGSCEQQAREKHALLLAARERVHPAAGLIFVKKRDEPL